MPTYSIDFRRKVMDCYETGSISIRKLAERFRINKQTITEWIYLKKTTGDVVPKKVGAKTRSPLVAYETEIKTMVEAQPDYTLAEYCEYLDTHFELRPSESALCQFFKKHELTLKKKVFRSRQAEREENQRKRCEYWEKIRDVATENLVFIDETGVLLGILREYARSHKGTRVYDRKPFYRGARITVIGAISLKGILALEPIGPSMTGEDYKQFLSEKVVPHLWEGAVLVSDNLKAHKVAGVKEIVEASGARIEYQSAYSPDFNPIEHLWWQLKAFLRRFCPTTRALVEKLVRLAVEVWISPKEIKNYFTHCCYCTP